MNSVIVLATCLARFSHPPLGLRCLMANLGDLASQTSIVEATLEDPPAAIAERILARGPRLVGLSVHIWNLEPLTRVAEILRRVAPAVRLVAGGPEVGWQDHPHPLADLVDCLVAGEAELIFPDLARALISGHTVPPVVQAVSPDLARVIPPTHLYTDHDLAHRLTSIEASRGCPYGCAYCLSARERRLRRFPSAQVLADLDGLLRRGARKIKFLDRSMNAETDLIDPILGFFLDHPITGLTLHLELVPDRLADSTRRLLARCPPDLLHLEIGVQSLSTTALAAVNRRMDPETALNTLRWLRHETGARLHVDLIAGLPGETPASLAAGFDALWALHPHELQFGILKRLRDTPLAAREAGIFNPHPPYDLLANPAFDFLAMQQLKRFARVLDLFANRGRFPQAVTALAAHGSSPFAAWMSLADRVQLGEGRCHGVSLERQRQILIRHLVESGPRAETAAKDLVGDGTATDRLSY